jgi:hypothetical protein
MSMGMTCFCPHRQSLRESSRGRFVDGQRFEADSSNYHVDPAEPRLWNMLTETEFEMCGSTRAMPPAGRSGWGWGLT